MEEVPRCLGVEPQFRVNDLLSTAEHYRAVLGFEIGEFFGDPPVFTQARRDRVVIQLGVAENPGSATRGSEGLGYNAYIWVDDVDALHEEYGNRGADIVDGPVDREYACRELVVRDCNGIALCFAEDIS